MLHWFERHPFEGYNVEATEEFLARLIDAAKRLSASGRMAEARAVMGDALLAALEVLAASIERASGRLGWLVEEAIVAWRS